MLGFVEGVPNVLTASSERARRVGVDIAIAEACVCQYDQSNPLANDDRGQGHT